MVSEKDRRRMRLIASAMEQLNQAAVVEAANRSAGANVEIGLRLGDAALLFNQHPPERPLPVALIEAWRRRHPAGALAR